MRKIPRPLNLEVHFCKNCGKSFKTRRKARKCEKEGIKIPVISVGDQIKIKKEIFYKEVRIIQIKTEDFAMGHEGVIMSLLVENSDGTREHEFIPDDKYTTVPDWKTYIRTIQEKFGFENKTLRNIYRSALKALKKKKIKILSAAFDNFNK